MEYRQRYSSFSARKGTAEISVPFAKVSSFQSLISRKQLRDIELQMVSAISFGWFADFGKNAYHYSTLVPTGLFWQMVSISIDDRTIKRVDHTKSLGLTIDAQLSWSKHVDEISKKVSSAIGALKRVRPFIPTDVAVQIYNALILPHFDYCSPVWDGLSGCLSDKLQKLQNRATRVITQSPFDTSSNA